MESAKINSPFRQITIGWDDEFDPFNVFHIHEPGCDCCSVTKHYFSKKEKLTSLKDAKQKLNQAIKEIDDWIQLIEESEEEKHKTAEEIEEGGGWWT